MLTVYKHTNKTHLSFHLIFLFKLYRLGDFDLVARSSKILRFIISEFPLNYTLLIEQENPLCQRPKFCANALQYVVFFKIQIVVRFICVAGDLIFDRSSSLKITFTLCRFDSKARAVRMRHTRIEWGNTTRLLHKQYVQSNILDVWPELFMI